MSAGSIWLISVFALVITGVVAGQDKAAPKKAAPKRVDDVQILQQFKVEQFKLVLRKPKIVGQRRFQILPWDRATRSVPSVRPNPLMTGDYSAALGEFDKTRGTIYTTRDTKTARKLLDDLDRELLDVRRALWQLEKARKGKKSTGVKIQPIDLLIRTETQLTVQQQLVLAQPWGHGIGHVRIGNRLVVHNGTNTFLVGDYRKAIDALHGSRGQLTHLSDPKKARKVLDKMSRQILDARGALWKRERAKKKAGY